MVAALTRDRAASNGLRRLVEDGHATERELAHAGGGWKLMLHNVKSQLERAPADA